jgi:hypothetical protein
MAAAEGTTVAVTSIARMETGPSPIQKLREKEVEGVMDENRTFQAKDHAAKQDGLLPRALLDENVGGAHKQRGKDGVGELVGYADREGCRRCR